MKLKCKQFCFLTFYMILEEEKNLSLDITKSNEEIEYEDHLGTHKQHIIDDSAFLHIEPIERPIFSANEVGKVTIMINQLKQLTGYDYSKLPLETSSTQLIYNIFHDHPNLDFLPIVNETGWIVGYFTKKQFLSLISENPYNRELLFRKDVQVKSFLNPNVVCLNAYSTLTEASEILMNRSDEIRFDPFVVTLDRKFFGISTVDKVLNGINVFLKRDLEAVKESQLSLNNFFIEHEKKIENTLDFISYVSLLHGPGGDFVKNYEINDEFSLVVILDVCGKGVKASSMVFSIVQLLNKEIQRLIETNAFNVRNFHKSLLKLNHELVLTTSLDLYATALFIVVNKFKHIITIFDCGHNLIWLKRKDKVYKLETMETTKSSENKNTSFLGISLDFNVIPISYKIKKDDILFSCSDGITEQINPQKEMYITRIEKILREFKNDMKKNRKLLLKDWNEFREFRRVRDDVSFFIFKL